MELKENVENIKIINFTKISRMNNFSSKLGNDKQKPRN